MNEFVYFILGAAVTLGILPLLIVSNALKMGSDRKH